MKNESDAKGDRLLGRELRAQRPHPVLKTLSRKPVFLNFTHSPNTSLMLLRPSG